MATITYDPSTETTAADPLAGASWVSPYGIEGAFDSSAIVEGATPAGTKFWRIACKSTTGQGGLAHTITSYSDMEVLVCVRRNVATVCMPGGFVRGGGSGTGGRAGYVGVLRNNTVDGRVGEWTSGSFASLAIAAHGFATTVDNWIWIRTRVSGSTIMVRTWIDGTAEPGTWLISTTDATRTSGWVGYQVFQTSNGTQGVVDLAWWSAGTAGDTAPSPTAGGAQTVNLARATETDVAGPATASNPRSYPVARALEVGTARAVTIVQPQTVVVARAVETGLARPLTAANPRTYPLGRATQVDLARPVTITKAVTTGRALEIDLARPLTVSQPGGITLGRALEGDTARPLIVLNPRAYLLGRAVELDAARPVTVVAGELGTPVDTPTRTVVLDTPTSVAVADVATYVTVLDRPTTVEVP